MAYILLSNNIVTTGVGSMGAPGAGAPMKFLSGTHTKSHFALKCSLCYRYSVHIGIEHPFTKSSSYAYGNGI